MTKYHINPKTGNPGICRASIQCRFGGASSHFTSKEEARADYEETQKRAATIPQSPKEALDLVEKEFKRGVELLDSTRQTDGSAFGSSKQSRAQKEWSQAQYVINQYVNTKETWAERRGFYGQVSDSLRKVGHEFGASSWGGPSEAHKDFLDRLEKLQKDFQALTGPEGAAKEKELGYFKQ